VNTKITLVSEVHNIILCKFTDVSQKLTSLFSGEDGCFYD